MKAQIYRPVKRQLILVLIILGFIAGSYAQKSAMTLKEDNNLKQLKSLVEILNTLEINYAGLYLQPVGFSDVGLGNAGSDFKRIIYVPEFAASDVSMLSEEKEEELEVEDWMLDENYFRSVLSNDKLYETEKEENLEVEDWMLDESHFISNDKNLNSEEDPEEDELQVENWMLDPNHWVLGAK